MNLSTFAYCVKSSQHLPTAEMIVINISDYWPRNAGITNAIVQIFGGPKACDDGATMTLCYDFKTFYHESFTFSESRQGTEVG